ncbi:MAG: MarR family winged helix-turn-helix transcriptional regulator [Actinomycetota bacterium]|nr:MarR family winged helix-turn-helix transcriptional regulator [Actinomycetota bacterium]
MEVSPGPTGPPALVPWLLRRTNQRYRAAVRERLEERGLTGLPQPGYWALTVLAAGGTDARHLVDELGVSKQAVSKLVDTLVTGGYVERRPNPTDRRRTVLVLTTSGHRAADAIADAVRATDAAFARELGAGQFAELVELLATLARGAPVRAGDRSGARSAADPGR